MRVESRINKYCSICGPKMRNEILKVRLTEEEHTLFTAACQDEKVAPATKARELVNEYSQTYVAKTTALSKRTEESGKSNNVGEMPSLPSSGALRVGEMFSGPGGIGVALNRTKSAHFSFEHAWATDWDADTCRTYRENVLKHTPDALSICEDVRKLDIDALPTADGFLYGFPCNESARAGQ